MNSVLRQKAILLRTENQLSYTAIQRILNVPKSTLSYWLKVYPLSEEEILKLRQKSWLKGEVSRERFRNTMRKKREALEMLEYRARRQEMADLNKDSFFVAGLMLYLGEGDKKNKYRVSIANADPLVIKFFLKWLRDFFSIEANAVHAELHLYDNMDIVAEKLFWINTTKLPESQFYKAQIRKVMPGRFSYKEPERHGTCSIIFDSVQKKMEIMMAIKALLGTYEDMRV